MILGLCGMAGCGKDTVADILVNEHGFKRIAFADALRKMARDVNPAIGMEPTFEPDCEGPTGMRFVHLDEAIDNHGYEHVKRNYPEARRFLQRLGTEGIRQNVRDTWWVDTAMEAMSADPDAHWVVTDCRFINEAQAISDSADGWVVLIERPDLKPLPGAHASEAGVPEALQDYVIHNDSDLHDLATKVDVFIRYLLTYEVTQ